MKKILRKTKDESAFSLVEAVIALALVGTAMVIITQVSLSTIKRAKKNELEDVAVQAGVEAMDFMKQPIDIDASTVPTHTVDRYYQLDPSPAAGSPALNYITSYQYEISPTSNCDSTNPYYHTNLGAEGYTICQQVKIIRTGPTDPKYDIEVLVVWKTIDNEYELRRIKGYRVGNFI